jgi:hypothetical protein
MPINLPNLQEVIDAPYESLSIRLLQDFCDLVEDNERVPQAMGNTPQIFEFEKKKHDVLMRMESDGLIETVVAGSVMTGATETSKALQIAKILPLGMKLLEPQIALAEAELRALSDIRLAEIADKPNARSFRREIARNIRDERTSKSLAAAKAEKDRLEAAEERRHREGIEVQRKSTNVAVVSAWIGVASAIIALLSAWYTKIQADATAESTHLQKLSSSAQPTPPVAAQSTLQPATVPSKPPPPSSTPKILSTPVYSTPGPQLTPAAKGVK